MIYISLLYITPNKKKYYISPLPTTNVIYSSKLIKSIYRFDQKFEHLIAYFIVGKLEQNLTSGFFSLCFAVSVLYILEMEIIFTLICYVLGDDKRAKTNYVTRELMEYFGVSWEMLWRCVYVVCVV